MNNLSDGTSENSFENYYSEIDISAGLIPQDKKTFPEKKCVAIPFSIQTSE